MVHEPGSDHPLLCGEPDGRAQALRAIEAEFGLARMRGPRGVLLTGEPGIGKSWTLRAAGDELRAAGALVLPGHALDLPGAPPAYPLARAFGGLLRALPSALGTSFDGAVTLLARAGLGGPLTEAPTEPIVDGLGTSDRLRVFEALLAVCEAVAAEQPIVLVLDDMQWAQPFAWDALQYLLLSAGSGVSLLVLLGAREELLREPQPAAARPLGDLIRLRVVRHVRLEPLDGDAVRTLAEDFLGGRISPELAEQLSRRSEGNPFFAEELLADWRDRGLLAHAGGIWSIADPAAATSETPLTLRLTIGARLDRLPPGAEDALAAGATLGRHFRAQTAAAMLDEDGDTLAAAVAPAEHAGLIDAVPGGWRFRHDTIREAVLARHTSSAQRLHRAAAGALTLEAGYAPGFESLAGTAYHWLAAGDVERGAPAALAAARAAIGAHATAEAVDLARSGRAALERLLGDAPPDRRVAEACLVEGEAALAAADFAVAAEPLTAAALAASRCAEPGLEGIAWLHLGVLHRRQERVTEAAGALTRALALLEQVDDGRHLAEALVELADLEGLTRARYAVARAAGERGRRLALESGDRRLAARALVALANIESRADDPRAAQPLLADALEEATASGDLTLAAEVCASLATAAYWAGEIRESWRHASLRLDLAERGGDLFAIRHAHSWLAFLAVTRGEWAAARSLIARSERALARLDSPEPLAFLRYVEGFMELRAGDLDRAIDLLGTALAQFESVDPATVVWYAGLYAFALARAGRVDEALRVAAEQEARLETFPASALPARSARCALGLLYAELGAVEAGARCEAVLRDHPDDFHWWPAGRVLAALAVLRGDRPGAVQALATVEARMRAEHVLPEVALAQLARAALLPAREAVPLADEAQRVLADLEMVRDADRARELLEAARAPAALSPREAEVLRLLAAGMTNRQIAEALVISERTAINHVSHVFDKLGVENRAAAVAYAHRHGLA